MTTTMTSFHHHKRLEGVKATVDLQMLFHKAVELSKQTDSDNETLQTFAGLPHSPIDTHLPIPIVRAMDSVFQQQRKVPPDTATMDRTHGGGEDSEALQKALSRTTLYFTPPPLLITVSVDDDDDDNGARATGSTDKEDESERKKFRQRMQRLRFQQEETKYAKLTNNLKMNPVQDDVTTKSMTYAASIGLNMIVAPISFGVFMYFFAGSLLDYVWPHSTRASQQHAALQNAPDIRKVIIGVVSGVAMLFIEMLLFVIRTHEMDKAMRKKYKKKQSPFGHYSSDTAKSYNDPDELHLE